MLPSDITELKNKIRQLQEDNSLIKTNIVLQVHRVLNTANICDIISDEQLEYLQYQIRKL